MRPRRHRAPGALFQFDSLEPRCLLSWGAIPNLIDQPQALSNYPSLNGDGEAVVVIDSGLDSSHPELTGKTWTNPGEWPGTTGVDADGDGLPDDLHGWDFYRGNNNPIDEVGHGEQVTGILAAGPWTSPSDSDLYEGIAPGVKVIPLKISVPTASSPQFDQHVGEALSWVVWAVQNHPEYHIVAVNLSLKAYDQSTYDQYEQPQIQELHDLGVFIAAAAGNDASTTGPVYPGLDPNVTSVGGVEPDGTLTPMTNRGPKIDMVAPGDQVPILQINDQYLVSGDGTSYATPYITGAAVLIKQIDPAFTPDQIKAILQDSATPVNDATTHLTYDLLDLNAALALAYSRAHMTPPRKRWGPSSPYASIPALPGTVQAENYDVGGEGVAYHTSDTVNPGGAYRLNEGVGIEATGDGGGGYDVAYTRPGDWLQYTVNVATSGAYSVNFRVASNVSASFHLEVDGVDVTGALSMPTGGWQAWTTVSQSGLNLTAGRHLFRIVFDSSSSSNAGNLNWFSITPGGAGEAPYPDPSTPLPVGSRRARALQAENFDAGGEGIGYQNTPDSNPGGLYRPSDGVPLEATSDRGGGYDVTATRAGEWLNYTINVLTAGAYTLAVRVASRGVGGTFNFTLDGRRLTRAMAVPNTRGGQTFTTLSTAPVQLSAGEHVLRLLMDSNGANGSVGNFNWVAFTYVSPALASIKPRRRETEVFAR